MHKYYKGKADTWYNVYNCFEYINHISKQLEKEEQNADYFLLAESKGRIVDIIVEETIQEKAKALSTSESGCLFMFIAKKNE